MKKIILLLIIFFNLNVYSQQKECSDYKVGKFTYTDKLYKNWKVIRSEIEQIETDEVNKIKICSSINWISECEYILTYTKFNESEDHPIVGQKLKVKIIKVGNDSIFCLSEGLGIKLELEMILEK